MTSTPNPTWYDVLGVSRDASPAEIKAAWRTATDKFEPGTGAGQFRMFNEAADVLLDPQRRAAYDESLDAAPSTGETAVADTAAPPPPAPVEEKPEKSPEKSQKQKAAKVRVPRPRGEAASGRAIAALALLAVLTAVAIVLAAVFGLQVRKDAHVADARDEAPAAAERAVKEVFAYDYQTLPADRKRAESYLTGSYRKEYDRTATALEKQKDGSPGLALQTKAVVTSTPLGSAVVAAEADAAQVLVYVNLTSKKAGATPQIFQNRVLLNMRKDGDRWLISKVTTY
jgi:Mce-associated membrane protein